MYIQVLKSKIHRVSVTEAALFKQAVDLWRDGASFGCEAYIARAEGEAVCFAHYLPGERVYIVNNNNGARLDTYTIPGERGSGTICLNAFISVILPWPLRSLKLRSRRSLSFSNILYYGVGEGGL